MSKCKNPIRAESQQAVLVTGRRHFGGDVFLLRFRSRSLALRAQPGQFLHLRVPGNTALLRRPFSIHDVTSETVSILYRVVGGGTKLLSRVSPGEMIDVIGPLGHPFTIDARQRQHIVVAGGMGIAPLQLLLRRLRAARCSTLLCYGCPTKNDFLPHLPVKKLTTTDDGSCGTKGYVTTALQREITRYPGSAVYACGPWPMLRAVSQVAGSHHLSCQVSLESFMACGIGACQGCVVKTTGGYRTVCHDGPVFDSTDIDWSQEPVV